MPRAASEEKALPDVPANVLAGKRRARARAIGSTMVAFGTLACVVSLVMR